MMVHQQMARYPFVHSSALFLCTFFPYFTLALFSCCTFSRVALCCTRFMCHFFCDALISCWALSVLHFFILHSFQVALFCVIPCSCCTFLCVAPFSCCTFSRVAPCCIHIMLHFFVLHSFRVALFRVALFPHCTFFMLYSFWVSRFSCCTHFVLHFFRVAHFSCRTLFMWHLLSCCPVFILHLFTCCTPFMLHLLSYCLMLHSVHVGLFSHSGQQILLKRDSITGVFLWNLCNF